MEKIIKKNKQTNKQTNKTTQNKTKTKQNIKCHTTITIHATLCQSDAFQAV